ncbi:hypothetical protein BSF42_07020 [Flavobacterium sp. ACN6]|nr:hypothetical protein BSF42_07020 [Flavobacterium sp. ACN6]
MFEPTYVGVYKAEKSRLDSRTNEILKGSIEYNAIELPIGLRYYMFLNNESSVFLLMYKLLWINLKFKSLSRILFTKK